jgi:ketosteroid isomerase-like protein
MTPDFSE